VLQQIVGQPSTPMPRPPAARGAGAPISDGVPGMMAEPAASNAPTSAVGGRGAVPPGMPSPPSSPLAGMVAGPIDASFDAPTSASVPAVPPAGAAPAVPGGPIPGAGVPPGGFAPHTPPGMPAHLAPYAIPQGGGYPGAGQPGAGQPGAPQAQYPFQPYPGGVPQSFTKQMQALVELDELPAHYRLPSAGTSWLLRALLVVVALAAVGAIAMLIVRTGGEPPIDASLLIDSTPSGATVTVDGVTLPDKTPARFETRPGARHDIVVDLAGYKTYTDAVLVPDGGGQIRVFAFLPAVTVRLKVVTVPPGADVYLGEALKGRSPIEIGDLDPEAARELEVRLKDYPPEKRTLTWEGKTEQTVEIRLRK
jgi:hypothetical protein